MQQQLYADNKVTVTIENVSVDAIVGNGGSGSTDFTPQGVRDVSGVSITNNNNKSVYTFTLTREVEYRMFIDEEGGKLRLEFKH